MQTPTDVDWLKLGAALWGPLFNGVEWGDMWRRTPTPGNGAALEWALLGAILSEAQERNLDCKLPLLDLPDGRHLYTLRNEIPLQFGAQAGHAAYAVSGIPLTRRMLQSFIPKAVIRGSNGIYLSIFREGCSYHQAMRKSPVAGRPDILFLPGQPHEGFPRLIEDETVIEFQYDLTPTRVIRGQLQVLNSPTMPLRWVDPSIGISLPVVGIVECSVNKPRAVATLQLTRYQENYASPSTRPLVALMTGNELVGLAFPYFHVDLTMSTVKIEGSLRLSAAGMLDLVGLS